MATLTDLSNEILLMLYPYLYCDRPALVLVNHHFYDLWISHLYARVELDCQQSRGTERLIRFMTTVTNKPDLASYVLNLTLKSWTSGLSCADVVDLDQTNAIVPCKSGKSYYQRGCHHIILQRDDVARFLVSNLPNLDSLELFYGPEFTSIAGARLLKLDRLFLERNEEVLNSAIPVSELAFFMSLPKLDWLSATDMISERSHLQECPESFHLRTESLTKLELDLNMICDSELIAIIASAPYLDTLILYRGPGEYCKRYDGATVPIHCHTVMKALQSVKDSLEEFDFFSEQLEHCSCGSDHLDTFANFPYMESLSFAPELLFKERASASWATRASDLLPASLKNLTMYIDTYSSSNYEDMWISTLSAITHSDRLQHLEFIKLDLMQDEYPRACSMCGWRTTACHRCSQSFTGECNLCHRSELVEKMLRAYAGTNTKLLGPWDDSESTKHPTDHAAVLVIEQL